VQRDVAKLARQVRTRLVAAICVLGPFAFVVAVYTSRGDPARRRSAVRVAV
jgi:hypothetical protein